MTSNQKTKRSDRHPLLGAIVLFAMAVAALAFGAGLHVQGGVGAVSAAIAGVAVFFVMAASHAAFVRSLSDGDAGDRIAALENTFERLARNVELINQAGETGERVEELAQRVNGLKQLVDKAEKLGSVVDASAHIKRLTGETERLDARLEALRSQMTIESQERYEELKADFRTLESQVRQMAERHAPEEIERDNAPTGGEAGASAPPAVGAAESASPSASTPQPAQPRREPLRDASAEQPPDTPRRQEQPAPEGEEAEGQAQAGAVPAIDAEEVNSLLLEEIRRSVEASRIELHLQPIMTVPQRRVRYYEALSRLKNERDQLIQPRDYLPLAENAGLMPVIDNVMLFRSVQVLRRLEKRSSARGVFCNISVRSLLDPEFFQEFIAFMEQNTELARRLFFEFSQKALDKCGPVEQESLDALAALGFRFSLDQVSNLDIDFQDLHARGFRTLKLDAGLFLNGMGEAGARIHPADMKSYLERFGMQLVIEKIEDEKTLASVLDHHVELGQGHLFSEPRPVRPEVFGEKAGDAAAA